MEKIAGSIGMGYRAYALASLLLAVCLGLTLVNAKPAQAAPGDLDPTFNGNGKVTTDLGSEEDDARGVAVQPDGKILVAGYQWIHNASDPNASHYRGVLVRYNPGGSLDTAFGSGGKVIVDFGYAGADSRVRSMALRPDGKIVVAGEAANGVALARYNPDGSPDTTFGSDGKVRKNLSRDVGSGYSIGNAVAIQPDGKMVVAGAILDSGTRANAFLVARFNPGGSLDTTFGSNGRQVHDFTATFDEAYDVAVRGDGKIVAVGSVFGLLRLNPDGSFDASFGTNGTKTVGFGGRGTANAVAFQADGKAVVSGGVRYANGSEDFALARLKPDGTADATFSGNGKTTTDFGGYDEAEDLAVQSNGKIVAAGHSIPTIDSGGGDFALARYKPDGSLDTTFGRDGKTTMDFGAHSLGRALALQPDGKMVVAGWYFPHTGDGTAGNPITGNGDFALARFFGDPPKVDVTLKMATTDLELGGYRLIAGSVSPAHPGKQVKLTIKRDGAAYRTETLLLDDDSDYYYGFKPPSAGTYAVRASFAGDGDHLGNTSPTKSFKAVPR